MDLCRNFDRDKAIHIKSLNIYKNLQPRNPIVRTFCKERVRRKGLTDEDVNRIVEDLKTWKQHKDPITGLIVIKFKLKNNF